ncbi:ABC transporter ATP-binding protein [Alicyclobacillus fodiniaquatilis]|uniref:ABC transporter ATP-binding protein n=1 Tax=Alicyclobacillus fodiniaquatilis TaxID=1661150 RepID=A0ABW4JD00_9BACL
MIEQTQATTLVGSTDGKGAALVLKDVHKRFVQRGRDSHVLRGVNLTVGAGKIVALVGESGSGKSTLARTIMRLYRPDKGKMLFDGVEVGRIRGRSLKDYRSQVQMLFQDPFASLNPTHTIRTIMAHSLPANRARMSRREKDELFASSLARVGLNPPSNFLAQFPHELSGGQRQRVALARSLAAQPKLVLADEPVSMLDVSLRLSVLNLMQRLNEELNIGYLYITHDLASARYVATRIAVMYAGEIVEEGTADEVIEDAKHPYTQLLIQAAPDPNRQTRAMVDTTIFRGEPPNLTQKIVGCPFQFRCPHVNNRCRTEAPNMVEVGEGHKAKCHLFDV